MQAKFLLTAIAAVFTLSSHAQSLEKMQWFNEPESYTIKGCTLEIDVPAKPTFGAFRIMALLLMTARSSMPHTVESLRLKSR